MIRTTSQAAARLRLAGAVLLGLAVALGSLTARADTVLKIIFPTTPHLFALPHLIAQDKGWLKAAGLDVQEQWLAGGGDSSVIRLVLSGDEDMGVTGTLATYSSIEAGAKLKAFASQQSLLDYQLVTNKSIATFKDLAGKRFAGGPAGDITTEVARIMMKRHGVDIDTLQVVQAGGTPQRLRSLIAGQTDATLIGTEFALQAKKYPQLHVLASVPKEIPGMGFSYIIATDKTLSDPAKRKALEIYTEQAVIRASRFIVDHPAEATDIYVKYVKNIDPKLVREAIDELTAGKVWGTDGGIAPAITDFTVKFAVDTGNLKKPLSYEQVVDPTIVKDAMAQMDKK